MKDEAQEARGGSSGIDELRKARFMTRETSANYDQLRRLVRAKIAARLGTGSRRAFCIPRITLSDIICSVQTSTIEVYLGDYLFWIGNKISME